MLTAQQRTLANDYVLAKAGWSGLIDGMNGGTPRKPVPRFASPLAAVAFYFQACGNPYTGDPWGGAIDYYLNPERLQAALEAGKAAWSLLSIDCDDVALWYHHALRQLPGYQVQVLTLIDAGIAGSHVICVYTAPDGTHGGCDTNGHHVLPDLAEETVCAHWSALYAGNGYHYLGVVDSPLPF